MHGNVSEWCSDWYAEDYGGIASGGPAVDPTGPADKSFRVMRGGSWILEMEECRSASRRFETPYSRSWDYGFRLVWRRGSR